MRQSSAALGLSTVHVQLFDSVQQQLRHLGQTLREQKLEIKALVKEVANPSEIAYLYALPEFLHGKLLNWRKSKRTIPADAVLTEKEVLDLIFLSGLTVDKLIGEYRAMLKPLGNLYKHLVVSGLRFWVTPP